MIVLNRLGDLVCQQGELVGAGGMGKTRLALQVCRDVAVQRLYPDGVYFVSLAPLTSAEFIVQAIAQALGYPMPGYAEPKQELYHFLRKKQLLLLLDNFEHLLDGTPLILDLLRAAPWRSSNQGSRHSSIR